MRGEYWHRCLLYNVSSYGNIEIIYVTIKSFLSGLSRSLLRIIPESVDAIINYLFFILKNRSRKCEKYPELITQIEATFSRMVFSLYKAQEPFAVRGYRVRGTVNADMWG